MHHACSSPFDNDGMHAPSNSSLPPSTPSSTHPTVPCCNYLQTYATIPHITSPRCNSSTPLLTWLKLWNFQCEMHHACDLFKLLMRFGNYKWLWVPGELGLVNYFYGFKNRIGPAGLIGSTDSIMNRTPIWSGSLK